MRAIEAAGRCFRGARGVVRPGAAVLVNEPIGEARLVGEQKRTPSFPGETRALNLTISTHPIRGS